MEEEYIYVLHSCFFQGQSPRYMVLKYYPGLNFLFFTDFYVKKSQEGEKYNAYFLNIRRNPETQKYNRQLSSINFGLINMLDDDNRTIIEVKDYYRPRGELKFSIKVRKIELVLLQERYRNGKTSKEKINKTINLYKNFLEKKKDGNFENQAVIDVSFNLAIFKDPDDRFEDTSYKYLFLMNRIIYNVPLVTEQEQEIINTRVFDYDEAEFLDQANRDNVLINNGFNKLLNTREKYREKMEETEREFVRQEITVPI